MLNNILKLLIELLSPKMKGRKDVIVKLTAFETSKREYPIYKIKAYSSEKDKGNMMVQSLKSLFDISDRDEQNHFKREVEEQKKLITRKNFGSTKIEWTRDEGGKIISPFSAKLKKKKEEDL